MFALRAYGIVSQEICEVWGKLFRETCAI